MIESEIQISLTRQGTELLSPENVPIVGLLEGYEKKLNQYANTPASSVTSPEQRFIDATILSHVFLLGRKYSNVIEITSTCSEFLNSNASSKYSYRYSHVAVIKHLAIAGTAYEALNKFDQAIELYDSASRAINDDVASFPEALLWAEQLYYRFGKLATSYKWDNSQLSLTALKGYSRISGLLSQHPTTRSLYSQADGLLRRVSILNIHFVYSSALLQSNPTHEQTKQDVDSLSNLFEKILFESSEASKSTDSNEPIEQFIETMMQNWRKTMTFSAPLEQVYTQLDVRETNKMLLILRRATVKTFHSCAIMRHLVFVLSALGQYKEALMAFESYTSYQEKVRIQREKANTAANTVILTENALSPHGSDSEPVVPQASPFNGDDDKSVIRVFTKAINILVRVELDGRRAKEAADKLRSWFYTEEESEAFAKEKNVSLYHNQDNTRLDQTATELATAWASVAQAYSLFGFQAFTSAEREQAFVLAVNSFEKSIYYTHDATDAQICADYGLLLARISKIPKALEAVRRGLIVDSDNYTSWHLLALLLASLSDYDKALHAINNTINMVSKRKQELTPLEKRCFLQVKVSQVAIYEAVHGIDRALELIAEVFVLFGELFPESASSQDNSGTTVDTTAPNGKLADIRPSTSIQPSTAPNSDQMSLRPIFSRLSIKRLSSSGKKHVPHPHIHLHHHEKNKSQSNAEPSTPTAKRLATRVLKPSDSLQKEALADLWVWAASVYRRAELYTDAEEALIEAENVNGPTAASYVELGLLIRKTRPLHAMEEFESALEKEPNNLAAIVALSQLILEHVDLNKKLKQRQEEKRKKIEEEVQREIRLNQSPSFKDPFVFKGHEDEGFASFDNGSEFRPYHSDDEDDDDDEEDEDDDGFAKPNLQKGPATNGHSRVPPKRSSNSTKWDYYAKDASIDILFLSDKDEQAAVARVSGLLETSVHNGYGFNSSEAWYLLSQYLERNGDIQGSIAALWKSIGLEESRSVRDYVVSRWKRWFWTVWIVCEVL